MKQFYGKSQNGNLREAAGGLRNPQLILLMSNSDQFSAHVSELESLFPGVPSIGCIGMSYDTTVVEKGVGIVAFTDHINAAAGVIEQVSTMPVKYINRLKEDVQRLGARAEDTVCIDFCSGNDACVLTTLYSVLGPKNIPLVGGTGDAGKISVNGRIYEDAAAYALVKNQSGRVGVYKENIYRPRPGCRFIASGTDRSRYIIGALNGKPAKNVYQDLLHISEKDITTQTFKNPFGKMNGQDICIISIKEVSGNSLACFRQVNDSDVLILLELGDYQAVVRNTIQEICRDFPQRSAVFSVNCLFRYKLFSEHGYMQQYLRDMAALGNHAGFVGYGEHYNNRFVNQSMTCVVFE